MNWYVVYTKPRHEKKVADALLQIGINAYCPMKAELKQWSDRKKKVTTPLLSSYVFVQIEEAKRNHVFNVSGVVRFLFWLGKPALVRNQEIYALKEFTQNTYSKIVSRALQPGEKIQIEKGAFAGQHALIKEVLPNKLILILESIGVLLTMEK
ncbi:MAG TPA: antitermination protein NusG [Flavobacterium sp.]|nr:antitermination protein NusG [Flavobacterium sp.]